MPKMEMQQEPLSRIVFDSPSHTAELSHIPPVQQLPDTHEETKLQQHHHRDATRLNKQEKVGVPKSTTQEKGEKKPEKKDQCPNEKGLDERRPGEKVKDSSSKEEMGKDETMDEFE